MGKEGPAASISSHAPSRRQDRLRLAARAVQGADFNGIFAGLSDGSYDCVASGATITPGRQAIADFCTPYCVSGQSLVVDAGRHPRCTVSTTSRAW
jgi:ABC-type amino acid transport substrate-binding protein